MDSPMDVHGFPIVFHGFLIDCRGFHGFPLDFHEIREIWNSRCAEKLRMSWKILKSYQQLLKYPTRYQEPTGEVPTTNGSALKKMNTVQ